MAQHGKLRQGAHGGRELFQIAAVGRLPVPLHKITRPVGVFLSDAVHRTYNEVHLCRGYICHCLLCKRGIRRNADLRPAQQAHRQSRLLLLHLCALGSKIRRIIPALRVLKFNVVCKTDLRKACLHSGFRHFADGAGRIK